MQTNAPGVTADRAFIAHISVTPVAMAVGVNDVLAAVVLAAIAQNITVGITDPDVPRVVRIKGNQATVAGNVVITGTNIKDEVIIDTIASNGVAAVNGTKAFKTITSVGLPVEVAAGDAISVGLTNGLGAPFLVSHNTVLAAYINNVKEAVAPTVTVSPTHIELNTATLNTALNGNKVDIYLLV